VSEPEPYTPEPEPWFYRVRKTRFVPANGIGMLVLLGSIIGIVGSVLVTIRGFQSDNTVLAVASIIVGVAVFCFLNWACVVKSATHPLERQD